MKFSGSYFFDHDILKDFLKKSSIDINEVF